MTVDTADSPDTVWSDVPTRYRSQSQIRLEEHRSRFRSPSVLSPSNSVLATGINAVSSSVTASSTRSQSPPPPPRPSEETNDRRIWDTARDVALGVMTGVGAGVAVRLEELVPSGGSTKDRVDVDAQRDAKIDRQSSAIR